jgi:hypothetical protein
MKLSPSPRVPAHGGRAAATAALLGLLAIGAAAQTQRASERAPARPAKATAAAASAAVATAAPALARAASAPAVAASAPAGVERADRADLDRTQIIGNRELPKVLYIVPWKRPISGAMERPVKSIIDEVFAPLDREVLRRQVRYEAQVRTAGEAAMESAATGPTMPSK